MEISLAQLNVRMEQHLSKNALDAAWEEVREFSDEKVRDAFYGALLEKMIPELNEDSVPSLQTRVNYLRNENLCEKFKLEIIMQAFHKGCLDVIWARTCFATPCFSKQIVNGLLDAYDALKAQKVNKESWGIDELYRNVEEAIRNKEIERAETMFAQLCLHITKGQGSEGLGTKVLLLRAKIFLIKGSLEEAFNKALSISNDFTERDTLIVEIAEVYFKKGKYEDVFKFVKKEVNAFREEIYLLAVKHMIEVKVDNLEDFIGTIPLESARGAANRLYADSLLKV